MFASIKRQVDSQKNNQIIEQEVLISSCVNKGNGYAILQRKKHNIGKGMY